MCRIAIAAWAFSVLQASLAFAQEQAAAAAPDDDRFAIFDELRLGALASVDEEDTSGGILSGQLYFKPFGGTYESYLAETLLRPRLHIGGNVATEDDGVSQIYAGLTWNFPVFEGISIEASFGGTLHDGPLASFDSLDLGCEWLFHESIGVSFDLGRRWRVVTQADHSSHAMLCEGGDAPNSGVTHVGVYTGYRF